MSIHKGPSHWACQTLLLAGVMSVLGNVATGQTPFQTVGYGVGLVQTVPSFDLPTARLAENPSPSDQQTPLNPTDQGNPTPETPAKLPSKDSADKIGSTRKDSIAPVTSRQLSPQIQAVSISSNQVGTGLVPTPKQQRPAAIYVLPDGISRGMYHTQICWWASNIRHFPLYFEDPMLERHGHKRCCYLCGSECAQSVVSGAKFFGTIFALPYLYTLQPKHECVYSLGPYRAGSGAPCLRDNLPYDRGALIVESATAAAFFWAMPL